MSDQSSSSSRREPQPGEPAAPGEQPADAETATTEAARPRRGWRQHLRTNRVKLAAAAAVIFLAGGAGGFAVASAASSDDARMHAPGQGHPGPDGEGDGHQHGFGGPHAVPPNAVPPSEAPGQDGTSAEEDDT